MSIYRRKLLAKVKNNFAEEYLTFKFQESGTMKWTKGSSQGSAHTIQYRKNGGSWISITSTTSGANITVAIGDELQWKGTLSSGTAPDYQSNGAYDYFGYYGSGNTPTTPRFDVYGNLGSLVYGDNFASNTNMTSPGPFARLFFWSSVYNAQDLILPWITINSTYGKTRAYQGMFWGSIWLITAPELPATTLRTSCYESMFKACTSLTMAPFLPATALQSSCYYSMFDGCTSLNYIKAYFLTTPGTSYTSYWVRNVASTGTFIKNPSATWNVTGVNGVPSGWTVETGA